MGTGSCSGIRDSSFPIRALIDGSNTKGSRTPPFDVTSVVGIAVSCKFNFPDKEKKIVLISLILGRKLLGSPSDQFFPSHLVNTTSEKQEVSYSIVQKSKAILRKFNPVAVQLIWRNKQENL